MSAPFEKFIKIANFFYASIGIQPYQDEKVFAPGFRKKSILLDFIFYTSAINLNLQLVGELAFVFMAFYTGTHFLEAIVTGSCIGFVTIADCKMVSVWYKKKVLTHLINELRQIYPRTVEKQKAYKLKQHLRQLTIIMVLFASLYMLLIWTFNLFTSLQYIIYSSMGAEIEKSLPYNIYLPSNWGSGVWYYVLYVSQIIAGYTSAAGIISSDLLLCAIVTQVCMHYDFTKRQIEEFTPRGGKGDVHFFKGIILYHQKVLQLSDEINSVFGIPLLFNFATSSFIICFVGFQMTTGVTNEEIFKYLLFLLSSLVQVYLICYYGQRISTSSENIAVALYNQTWYKNASSSYKKSLIFMMKRSQKPTRLKATLILPISLGTFTQIGQLSYKFFAILRTMYIEK